MNKQPNRSNPSRSNNPAHPAPAIPNQGQSTKLSGAIAPSGSETLSPSDHLELLIGLLKPGSMELVRRWVNALMMVPEEERESIVQAVETQIVADYPR